MNRRLAKFAAAFGAAAAITGLTGCNRNFSFDPDPVPPPPPPPTSQTYYFNDARTDLCFSSTFTEASSKDANSISRIDCTGDVMKKIADDAPLIKEKAHLGDIAYDRDPNAGTCFAGGNDYASSTYVPCTDKVMALVPPGKTGASIGPATPPQIEGRNTGDQDDLDISIPGTGIALGGDGVHGYPQIYVPGVYEGNNPLPVPHYTGPVPPGAVVGPHGENSRPVPTGTAMGPNGENYAFYGIVPYQNPDGSPTTDFTSPDTVVVDLAHPGTPLFTLHGISQASGAYDAKTDRMVIVGNTQSGHRALWQSDPVGQNAAWGNTLQQQGTFSGAMDGNRESQIVALPKNGFLVVGAGEGRDFFGNNYTLPIEAVTATTPQGLLTAPPTALVSAQTLPQVYGPTITDIREANGKEIVSMRVSTYGDGRYDPHTYKTTFPVKRM